MTVKVSTLKKHMVERGLDVTQSRAIARIIVETLDDSEDAVPVATQLASLASAISDVAEAEKGWKATGDCFERNAQAFIAMNFPDLLLVHGVVINQKDHKPMNHCWIEDPSNGTCIEKIDGKVVEIPKEKYYTAGKVQKTQKYSRDKVFTKLDTLGHWGPWEITCGR